MLGFTVGRSAEAPSRLQRSALAWSFSRHRYLNGPRACARAIYWRYVGSRGGHRPAAPDRDARRAWVLRHLASLPVLVGTVLHTALRQAVIAVVDDRHRPEAGRLRDGARFTLNHVWLNSQPDRVQKAWDNPAIYPALLEVLYHGSIPRREIAAVRVALRERIRNLVAAPLLSDLGAAARREVFVGDVFPVSFAEGVSGGPVAVWVSPDLFYSHRPDGSPRSLGRWRRSRGWVITTLSGTGRDDDGRLLAPGLEPTGPADGPVRGLQGTQGAAHPAGGTLAARAAPPKPNEYPLERLRLAVVARWLAAREVPQARGGYLGRVVDLAAGTERWYRLGATDMAAAVDSIRDDVERLRAFFAGGDPARPLPKAAWPKTSNRRACAACCFRMLCETTYQLHCVGADKIPRDRSVSLEALRATRFPESCEGTSDPLTTNFWLGEYGVINSKWGYDIFPSRSPINHEQCVSGELSPDGIVTRWRWTYDAGDDGVVGYPNVTAGMNYPGLLPSTTPLLPRRVDALGAAALRYDVKLDSSAVRGFNTLIEMNFYRDSIPPGAPSAPDIVVEISVNVIVRGWRAPVQEEVVIDGIPFEVHWAPTSRQLILDTKVERPSGQLSFAAFAAYAVEKGYLRTTDYFRTTQVGNEISSGRGGAEITARLLP